MVAYWKRLCGGYDGVCVVARTLTLARGWWLSLRDKGRADAWGTPPERYRLGRDLEAAASDYGF